ncbi:hypothetical protein VdG1_01123 [Verticillium dahliae VDG1]|nr:hypothetical protein VdG1_01123 [Verticillium dahliae VDG1]
MNLSGWLAVCTTVKEGTVTTVIENKEVAEIKDVQIRGMLSGGKTNTGSVAFGGPEGWLSIMQAPEAAAVFADFQVGANPLACTVDGAKRDRACFGGDVFVMGRSLAYSTADLDAWRGSIRLLTPEHRDEGPPPSYAFHSLTYALLLVVSIKDYWMHAGEREAVESCFQKLEKLIHYADKFTNAAGLIEAPPHLQMTWFPMGGPVLGVSSGLNSQHVETRKAEQLWNDELGILQMGASLPADGFSQDVNAYALTKTITSPPLSKTSVTGAGLASPVPTHLGSPSKRSSPEVRPGPPWICSGQSGIPCPPRRGPTYSGAHWEAMKLDGSPLVHDVSLAHGWAMWPVHLLPRYVAGLYPLTPGWRDIGVEPVLADLSFVECSVATPAGEVRIPLVQQDDRSSGTLSVTIPAHSRAVVKLPNGWALQGSRETAGDGQAVTRSFHKLS